MKLTLYVALDGTPLGLELEGRPWQLTKAERSTLGDEPAPVAAQRLAKGAQRAAQVVVFDIEAEPVGSEAKPLSEAPSAPDGAS